MKKAKQLNINRFAKHGSYTPEWVAPDRTEELAVIEAKRLAKVKDEQERRDVFKRHSKRQSMQLLSLASALGLIL